jgi:hypothetical protein
MKRIFGARRFRRRAWILEEKFSPAVRMVKAAVFKEATLWGD